MVSVYHICSLLLLFLPTLNQDSKIRKWGQIKGDSFFGWGFLQMQPPSQQLARISDILSAAAAHLGGEPGYKRPMTATSDYCFPESWFCLQKKIYRGTRGTESLLSG